MSSRPLVDSLETWPVTKLVTFIRHGLDDGKINGLVASIKAGQELPAILLLVDGARVTILDGHHRTAAWYNAGVPSAPAIVFRTR